MRPASDREWDSAWQGCDYATYFHSRAWAETWRDYSGGEIRPAPLHVAFDDGASAVLAISRRDTLRGLVPEFLLSPAGTFGGWVSADDLGDAHVDQLTRTLLAMHGRIQWRLNPYAPLRAVAGVEDDETHATPLERDFEAVRKRWSRGTKSNVNRAAKAGVEVAVADDLESWRGYFAAYEASLERWGETATTGYEWRLFELLHARREQGVKLWVGRIGGEVAAGALCVYGPRHVAYWHGAAREEHFAARPVNLVMAEAMRDACARAYSWFDFNPSAGLEGVLRFKRGFGAEALPAPLLRRGSPGARAVERGVALGRKARGALAGAARSA